jgi:hypothetical protein
MATVHPTVYPSDMPPILAHQESSYEYSKLYSIHWLNKKGERHARRDPSS